MKSANVILNLTKEGHHVHLFGVTPAELTLLLAEHSANAGGKCLDEKNAISDVKDIQQTDTEEVKRLRGKYPANKVNALFPGASPTLPKTFEEAQKLGPGITLPSAKLTEVKLV